VHFNNSPGMLFQVQVRVCKRSVQFDGGPLTLQNRFAHTYNCGYVAYACERVQLHSASQQTVQ
jgi:hypothetical protein